MCLGAIYWARLGRLWYACTKEDAAAAGFDDSFIYEQIPLPAGARSIPAGQLSRERGLVAFEEWRASSRKIPY